MNTDHYFATGKTHDASNYNAESLYTCPVMGCAVHYASLPCVA